MTKCGCYCQHLTAEAERMELILPPKVRTLHSANLDLVEACEALCIPHPSQLVPSGAQPQVCLVSQGIPESQWPTPHPALSQHLNQTVWVPRKILPCSIILTVFLSIISDFGGSKLSCNIPLVSVDGGVGSGVIVNVFAVEKSMYRGESSGDLSTLGAQDFIWSSGVYVYSISVESKLLN